MMDRWRYLISTIAQSELMMKLLSNLSSSVTQTIQQVSYVGMIVVGAYSITQGNLTMGGLIACTIISGRALSPLTSIPSLIVQWKHAEIALKGLNAIMELPSDRDSDTRLIVPETCTGHLKLEKAFFAYNQGIHAIEVPLLEFAPGDRVAIVGTVGSGKSTLVKLLSGLFKPTEGVAYLDGIDITHLAPEFVREHVGYLPQDIRLFQGTLRDNLVLGLPTPNDTQILKAAALTGLDQVIKAHPKGLELEISEGGRGLSGGQRQLVGMTRLLLAQPQIMLLDEPTASMDAQFEGRVMQHLFEEVAPNSIVIVVTHKPSFLPLVNRLVVVDKGRVALDGPRDEVLAKLRANTVTAPQAPRDNVSLTQ
jgi:ATP-binding cassette subfamily C protein LapB